MSLGRHCSSFLMEGAAQGMVKMALCPVCVAWPQAQGHAAPRAHQQNATAMLGQLLSGLPQGKPQTTRLWASSINGNSLLASCREKYSFQLKLHRAQATGSAREEPAGVAEQNRAAQWGPGSHCLLHIHCAKMRVLQLRRNPAAAQATVSPALLITTLSFPSE